MKGMGLIEVTLHGCGGLNSFLCHYKYIIAQGLINLSLLSHILSAVQRNMKLSESLWFVKASDIQIFLKINCTIKIVKAFSLKEINHLKEITNI